jgi:hypothetical protein
MAQVGHGGRNLGIPRLAQNGARALVAARDRGGTQVAQKADSRLEDPLALDEIELYGELVIAASASDEPLSQDQIDHVLGVRNDRA